VRRPAVVPIDLDGVAAAWRRALDADDRALAALGSLDGVVRVDTTDRRRSLAHERRDVEALLRRRRFV
jgi:hypothetical protein